MPSRYFTILALPSLALAVTLSDFTPRVQNLPSTCDKVYKQPIVGCSASDFTGNYGCSSDCISALQNLVPAIQLACSNAGVTGSNPLNAFISGDGPHSLCANAPSATTSTTSSSTSTTSTDQPTTTQAPPTTTSTTAPTTSSTVETTSSTSSSISTTSTSNRKTTTASSTTVKSSAASTTTAGSSTSAAFGLGGSSSTTISSSSSTAAASTSAGGGSNNSGGGSPFDTVSRGAGSSISFNVQQLFFSISVAFLTVL